MSRLRGPHGHTSPAISWVQDGQARTEHFHHETNRDRRAEQLRKKGYRVETWTGAVVVDGCTCGDVAA